MKFSELDEKKLSDEDIYDLIMSGVIDYGENYPVEAKNPDFLIVLGCSPMPLKARVVKMMQLYEKGHGKYVLFSGGKGWHKLFTVGDKKFKTEQERLEDNRKKCSKYKEMKLALKKTIFDKLDDPKLKSKKGKSYNKYVGKRLKQILNETEAEIGYKIMKAAQSVEGIPDDRLFFEQKSMNTIQNIKFSKKMIDDLQKSGKVGKIKNVMIITSSFHCRRAELSFKKYFGDIDVITCPSTIDLTENGQQFNKNSLMQNEKFMKNLRLEINAIKNYTNNGSINNADIEDYIKDRTILNRILEHQNCEIEI